MTWFVIAFISAFFSAVSTISEKKALFSISPLNFSFAASFVTLIFTLPFFYGVDYGILFSTEMLILLIKTLLGAAAYLCVMTAIKNLEISEALPLLALTPGLVAIAGVIFINDKLLLPEWIGIFLMLTGAYILEMQKGKRKLLDPFKTFFRFSKYSYVFIALLLFTVSSILDRLLLKEFQLPPITFMAFQQLFYVLIFLVIVLFRDGSIIKPFKIMNKNLMYLIILIGIFTVIYRYTQIEATKLAPAALVLSVKRLSVLFAVIFGGKIFREENLSIRIAAVVVILAGTTVLLWN